MKSKLVKAWGPYAVGTVVVDNKAEEIENPASLRVNPARFAKLQEDGHFAPAEPARPIPTEVKTSAVGEEGSVIHPIATGPAERKMLDLLEGNAADIARGGPVRSEKKES